MAWILPEFVSGTKAVLLCFSRSGTYSSDLRTLESIPVEQQIDSPVQKRKLARVVPLLILQLLLDEIDSAVGERLLGRLSTDVRALGLYRTGMVCLPQ